MSSIFLHIVYTSLLLIKSYLLFTHVKKYIITEGMTSILDQPLMKIFVNLMLHSFYRFISVWKCYISAHWWLISQALFLLPLLIGSVDRWEKIQYLIFKTCFFSFCSPFFGSMYPSLLLDIFGDTPSCFPTGCVRDCGLHWCLPQNFWALSKSHVATTYLCMHFCSNYIGWSNQGKNYEIEMYCAKQNVTTWLYDEANIFQFNTFIWKHRPTG